MDVLQELEDKYGDIESYCAVLGISSRTIRGWKNGTSKPSKRIKQIIADDLGLSMLEVSRGLSEVTND